MLTTAVDREVEMSNGDSSESRPASTSSSSSERRSPIPDSVPSSRSAETPDECGEVCFLCNDEFANKFALQQHMLDAHKRLRHFQCPDCGVLFLDKPSMMRHQRSLTACKLFNCEPCLRKFASKELLDAHVCRAKGRNLVCPHCERRYTLWDSFAVHMDVIHARTPRFQCQACGVAFPRQSQLKKHLAKMMKCIPLPFKCELCSRRFESQCLLGSHVCVASTSTFNPAVVPAPSPTTIGGRRPSPECTSTFNDPSALQLHIDNIRQKLKPYACTTCDKAFGTKGELTGHTKSGCARLGPSRILLPGESFRPAAMPRPTPPRKSGQMPPLTEVSFSIRQIGRQQFECSGCGQVFRNREAAAQHIDLFHFRNRCSKCKQGDKYFRDNSSLQDHLRRGCQPGREVGPTLSRAELIARRALSAQHDSQVIVISDNDDSDDEHADEGMLLD